MGNSLNFESDEDWEFSDDGLDYNVLNLEVNAIDIHWRSHSQQSRTPNLPVIREKPNLDKFQVSMKFERTVIF